MNRKMLILLISLNILVNGFTQRYGESDDFSYALKLYNEGFYDIAAQQFNLFVDKYSNSDRLPEAKYYLGLSLYNVKDYENARIEFQSMAVSFPEHSRAPEAWRRVGESYQASGKMEKAARAFETVKILYPKDPNAPVSLFQAAKIYYEINIFDKAELTLKDFLDRYPDSDNYPNGRLLYASLLLQKQDFDQAYKEYEKVLKSDAEPQVIAEAYLGLGLLYANLGQFERSKEQYQLILNKYSSTPVVFDVVMKYSEILAITEDYQSAKNLLNKYMSRYSSQFRKTQLSLKLAAVYFLQGDPFSARKAIESLSNSALSDSLAIQVNFYLANCYFEEKNYNKGIDFFKKVIDSEITSEIQKDYVRTSEMQLGLAYLNLKQYEQGVSELSKYLESNPDDAFNSQIYSLIFYSTISEGKLSEADRYYQEILINEPHHPNRDEMLYALAKSYFKFKDYQSAYSKFNNFIRDFTCSTKYDSAGLYLSIINDHYLVDQDIGVNKLARLVGRVLAEENKADLELELAKINLYQLKDLDEAIQVSQSVIKSSADSVVRGEAYHILGESYRKKAELKKFNGISYDIEKNKAIEALKEAMGFVTKVKYPDSLSFTFINETAGILADQIPVDKKIQYWRHFKSNYPQSHFVKRASVILAHLYQDIGKNDLALQELSSVRDADNLILAGNAYYAMGKIHYEQNNMERASEVLKDFLLNIDIHPMRANAYGLLAKISEKQGNLNDAAQFWARLREEYDYSLAALAAKNQIPEVYLLAAEFNSVIEYTEKYLKYDIPTDLVLRTIKEIPELNYYFYNGKAYFYQKDFLKARQTLLKYLYNSRDGKYRDETLFLLSEMSLEENDLDGALLHAQMITKNVSSPFYLQATARVADIYFEKGNYAEAQTLYASLIAKLKQNKTIQFEAKEMICLINQGELKQFNAKLSSFKKLHKSESNYNNYLANFDFEIGKYYYKNKNFNAAINKFANVVEKYKNTDFADDAEYYLGLTYTTLNKVDKAMEILSRFSGKYPNSLLKSNIYVTLGGLYYRAEKRELAVSAFQKAVETAQDSESRKLALSNLISLYRDLGLWDGVLTQARVYVEEFPNSDDLVDKKIIMGTAMINLNRYSEAVDHLKNLKFQANSEQEPEIQFYIGEAYFNAGQYESAIREFVKIPLLSKQTKLQWEASALYYSGQAYEKLGRKEDAIRMYREIVDRPGILVDLKREAQRRIEQLKSSG